MILEIFQAIAVMLAPVTDADVQALQSTVAVGERQSNDVMREHIQAQRVASALAVVDPDLVAAIAHHESRYSFQITPEAGHRVSCGVMTPKPQASCRSMTLLESYIDGAMHLREWIDAGHGNMWVALTGYGGGWIAVRRCQTERSRACSIASTFTNRAVWIKALRTRRKPAS